MEISHVEYKYSLNVLRNEYTAFVVLLLRIFFFFFFYQSINLKGSVWKKIVFCVCWKWLLANRLDSMSSTKIPPKYDSIVMHKACLKIYNEIMIH